MSNSYSLALGLNRHPRHYNHPRGNPGLVSRFAKTVKDEHEVFAYPELIEQKGLSRAEVGPDLECQLLGLMAEAENIHFQLDGLVARGRGSKLTRRQSQSIRDAFARGELGTAIPRNVTNWELYQVWGNFRAKATFYWKRKVIDLAEILQPSESADG